MQLAGQSDTGTGREEGDGPVFQNGKAEENRVSKNGLSLLKMVATHYKAKHSIRESAGRLAQFEIDSASQFLPRCFKIISRESWHH